MLYCKLSLKSVFTFSLILFSYISARETLASSKPDSLRQLLGTATSDTTKAYLFNVIAFELAFSNTDSALFYINRSLDISEKHLNTGDEDEIKFLGYKAASFHNLGVIYYYAGEPEKSLGNYFKAIELRNKLVKDHPHKLNFKNDLADSYNNTGILYKQQGDYEKALEYYLKVLTIYEAMNRLNTVDYSSKTGLGAAFNNIGLLYTNMGNYSESLQYHLKSLKVKEEAGDLSGIAYSYNNIGIVYQSQGNNELALENFMKSLSIRMETGNKMGMASSYNNIGNIYSDKGDYRQALDYFMKSLKLKEELGDKQGIAASYSNIGAIYFELAALQEKSDSADGHYKSALYYFTEVLKMDEANNDKGGIASSCLNIGSVLTGQGRYEEASAYLQRGLKMALETGEKDVIKSAYLGLSELSGKAGNYKEAFEYHRLYSQVKDSLINDESNRQITEMSARYESEKKEKKILLLEKDREKQEAESHRQRLFLLLVIAIALSAAIIAIIIFRSLRITSRQKRELNIKNQKIEIAYTLIEEQKKHIEEKHREQTDSITYARRLQEAILPPVALIKKYLPGSFVLYKPKDIIAGDFFWMETCATVKAGTSVSEQDSGNYSGEIVLIAAADCTGHGVPGAMVSVVCSNALNRAVKEFGLRDTGKILDKVTDLVLETFEKSSSEVKDGMDISLLKIEFTPLPIGEGSGLSLAEDREVRLQWSGANNPLWYIRDGNLKEIKADKQPVGKYDKRQPFTTHHIEYSAGSAFYLFTDGLPDQFGGPKGKKFRYKRFEENLLSFSSLEMQEQEEKIEKAFRDWKGALEQVDDVTVIGIRL